MGPETLIPPIYLEPLHGICTLNPFDVYFVQKDSQRYSSGAKAVTGIGLRGFGTHPGAMLPGRSRRSKEFKMTTQFS